MTRGVGAGSYRPGVFASAMLVPRMPSRRVRAPLPHRTLHQLAQGTSHLPSSDQAFAEALDRSLGLYRLGNRFEAVYDAIKRNPRASRAQLRQIHGEHLSRDEKRILNRGTNALYQAAKRANQLRVVFKKTEQAVRQAARALKHAPDISTDRLALRFPGLHAQVIGHMVNTYGTLFSSPSPANKAQRKEAIHKLAQLQFVIDQFKFVPLDDLDGIHVYLEDPYQVGVAFYNALDFANAYSRGQWDALSRHEKILFLHSKESTGGFSAGTGLTVFSCNGIKGTTRLEMMKAACQRALIHEGDHEIAKRYYNDPISWKQATTPEKIREIFEALVRRTLQLESTAFLRNFFMEKGVPFFHDILGRPAYDPLAFSDQCVKKLEQLGYFPDEIKTIYQEIILPLYDRLRLEDFQRARFINSIPYLLTSHVSNADPQNLAVMARTLIGFLHLAGVEALADWPYLATFHAALLAIGPGKKEQDLSPAFSPAVALGHPVFGVTPVILPAVNNDVVEAYGQHLSFDRTPQIAGGTRLNIHQSGFPQWYTLGSQGDMIMEGLPPFTARIIADDEGVYISDLLTPENKTFGLWVECDGHWEQLSPGRFHKLGSFTEKSYSLRLKLGVSETETKDLHVRIWPAQSRSKNLKQWHDKAGNHVSLSLKEAHPVHLDIFKHRVALANQPSDRYSGIAGLYAATLLPNKDGSLTLTSQNQGDTKIYVIKGITKTAVNEPVIVRHGDVIAIDTPESGPQQITLHLLEAEAFLQWSTHSKCPAWVNINLFFSLYEQGIPLRLMSEIIKNIFSNLYRFLDPHFVQDTQNEIAIKIFLQKVCRQGLSTTDNDIVCIINFFSHFKNLTKGLTAHEKRDYFNRIVADDGCQLLFNEKLPTDGDYPWVSS